jgi:hypothetical protein
VMLAMRLSPVCARRDAGIELERLADGEAGMGVDGHSGRYFRQCAGQETPIRT